MRTLKRLFGRVDGPLLHGVLAGSVIMVISALGLFYLFVGVIGVDMWVRDFDARIGAIRRAGIGAFAAVAVLSVFAGFVVSRLSRTARRARRRDRIIRARLTDAKQQAEVQAQRAEAASKAKSDFLAMMSHEIRTPMNGVLGFVNLLLETPLDAEQREFAETVQRSGDSLLAIINDVLDYSKIEAGRMTVEQIEFDLRAVCEEVRAILQPALSERKLVMSLAYDATLPQFVQGDPVRIRQILLNLAGNAVKFTERGAVLIEVSRHDPNQIKFTVTDTGIGITTQQMDLLFRRFTQANSSTTRRYGGTGLGLAISKTLVELMGGSIGAQSDPGAGSTFWFTLPLIAALNSPPASSSTAPLLTTVADGLPRAPPFAAGAAEQGGRLLLVEDNFVNQRVAVYMLAKLGHQVEVAKHGREAIDMLSRSCYDLVLMDCQMPEMDGFEATRIIRDRASSVLDHEVPVVAMTANAYPEDRARALACGMNDFLAKPVDRPVLAHMLAKWLKPGQEREPRAAAG